MFKTYPQLSVLIYGTALACCLGTPLRASRPCPLEEVFEKEIEFQIEFADRTLDFLLQKGAQLDVDPEQGFDKKNNTLTAALDTTSSFPTAPFGRHRIQKKLVVKTKSGRSYSLRIGEEIGYVLSPSRSGYRIRVPKDTRLVLSDDPENGTYSLAEQTEVQITPPRNARVTLKVDAGTMVDRVPGKGDGTTLQLDPERAPVGEFVTLTIRKTSFRFDQSDFVVCLRRRGMGDAEPYIASEDVELLEVQPGHARIRARIPDIGEDPIHFARSVDLFVTARTDDSRAEVLSQQFSVSSRGLATLSWIAAIILPWLIAGRIQAFRPPRQIFRVDPIWFVSGKYGVASLSLAQILLWTMLVFSASFYVLVVSGKLLALTGDVLILLGIAGSSSVIARINAQVKSQEGAVVAQTRPREPQWIDLFQSDGRPDLYKVQMALFTALAAFFVSMRIYSTLLFPELPEGLLTLIGISNGVYLAAKVSSKTIFERLAEAHRSLENAQEDLKKRKKEADEVTKSQEAAQKGRAAAEAELASTKAEFEAEADPVKKAKLSELLESLGIAAQAAEDRSKKAGQKKKEADEAKFAAETKVSDLQKAFDSLKKEAAK